MSDTKQWLRNLPNKLTLARIAAIPLLLVLYPLSESLHVFCAGLFAAAALTDLLDGYLARKYGNVTPLGALLDPIADKMLIAGALVLLAAAGAVPAFVAGFLICRDIAVNGIRLLALEQNMHVEVNDFGKWKTTFLSLAIGCLLINTHPFLEIPWRPVGMILLWLGFGLSMYSAWVYGRGFLQKSKMSF